MQLSLFEDDREKDRKSRIFGTPEFQKAYADYIRSPEWRKLRAEVKKRAKGRCERCKKLPRTFTVHHLNYDRFRCERLDDLEGLCPECHDRADKQREAEVRARFIEAGESAQREKAMETYFEKKYGEEWRMMHMAEPMEMEGDFDDWRQRKQSGEEDGGWY